MILNNLTHLYFVFILYVFLFLLFNLNPFSWCSGTNDGQTKVVREGDNGVAYSWNSRDQKWDKVLATCVIYLFLAAFMLIIVSSVRPKFHIVLNISICC